MPKLTEGTVYLCMVWLEDLMYFHHRSVRFGNYCAVPQTNLNLSKFTSVDYSSKQLLIVVNFWEMAFFFMYKIQGKLGLLKREQENQNNSSFVYKMMSSGTADTAQAWWNGVKSFVRALWVQSKRKRKQNQQQKTTQLSPSPPKKNPLRSKTQALLRSISNRKNNGTSLCCGG